MAGMTFCDAVIDYDVAHLHHCASKEYGVDLDNMGMHFVEANDGFGLLQLPYKGSEDHFHQHQQYGLRFQQRQPYHWIPAQTCSYPSDADEHSSWKTSDDFISAYSVANGCKFSRADGVRHPVTDSVFWESNSRQFPVNNSKSPSSVSPPLSTDQRQRCDTYRSDNDLYRRVMVACDQSCDHNDAGTTDGRRASSTGCHVTVEPETGEKRQSFPLQGDTTTAKRMEVYPWMMESRHSAEKLHRQRQQKQLLAVLPGESLIKSEY